jgi:hypothetical protein
MNVCFGIRAIGDRHSKEIRFVAPAYTLSRNERKPKVASLIGVPALVSTIDFLMFGPSLTKR